MIHLGYAVEYNQPALVAEALAMAAIHEVDTADLTNFLIGAEKAAGGGIKPGKKTLRKILDEARADDDVRNSWRQGLQVELIKNTAHNALDGLTRYSSQYSVGADQVEDRFIEMVDLCGKSTNVPAPVMRHANQWTSSLCNDRHTRQDRRI